MSFSALQNELMAPPVSGHDHDMGSHITGRISVRYVY
jgi:hypothetical protein